MSLKYLRYKQQVREKLRSDEGYALCEQIRFSNKILICDR